MLAIIMIEFENTAIVITARMTHQGLPGRPMADINGLPMVAHTWKRAIAANIGHVLVAAAENRIAEAIRDGGGDALMSPSLLTAEADQIAAVLALRDPHRRFQYVMNLPASLPNIEPLSLRRCLAGLTNDDVDIATLAAPWKEDHPSHVKVVAPLEGEREAAYARDFTRASLQGNYWHHIGVYAYRRAALEKFAAANPSLREKAQGLEQLRALDAGLRVAVVKVDSAPLSVDMPQDLEAMRRMLKA